MRPLLVKKRGLILSFGVFLAALVVFATAAYAQDPAAGKTAWEENCGFCHGQFAQGGFTVPMLAGAAGHLGQLGVPPEAVGPMLRELVREGIPERMEMFPPDVLSDADVDNIAAYLLTTPPATGTSIYISRCSFCHGLSGEGNVGPPLNTSKEFIQSMGWTNEQAAVELAGLVRGGIPGRMPQFPTLTDIEIQRIVVAITSFDGVQAWETQFTRNNGRPPALLDRLDWAWALEFQAVNGRAPTQAEIQARMMSDWRGQPAPGGPPPGAAPAGS